MSNYEHVEILKKGVENWNEWRKKEPDIEPDLEDEDFFCMNLQKINLKGALLEGANFHYSDLQHSNFERAIIGDTKIRCADLRHATIDISLDGFVGTPQYSPDGELLRTDCQNICN